MCVCVYVCFLRGISQVLHPGITNKANIHQMTNITTHYIMLIYLFEVFFLIELSYNLVV